MGLQAAEPAGPPSLIVLIVTCFVRSHKQMLKKEGSFLKFRRKIRIDKLDVLHVPQCHGLRCIGVAGCHDIACAGAVFAFAAVGLPEGAIAETDVFHEHILPATDERQLRGTDGKS